MQTQKLEPPSLYSIINGTTGKLLLSNFHLNGYTLGFHKPTQKLEPPCTT